ncbi:hypothetical protein AZE42_01701 [Rhizopogon vesiculosus]|uniref:Uncharacterized protein n=1 Tax=Rhizopogon vesiculosus TaxID=180088 RepID=A0A1J8PN09_9AGAM|nr:hypothetical protein AZE42_01701 [Rhizopogon vesiculosus]
MDGKQLAVGPWDPVKTFEGHEDTIFAIAAFPDGKRIVTGSVDKTIRIWRLEDGREMKKWAVEKRIHALVILRNRKHVVSPEEDSPEDSDKTEYWQVYVRDADTRRVTVVAGPFKSHGHTNAVLTLDISPDSGILASGSLDGTIIL